MVSDNLLPQTLAKTLGQVVLNLIRYRLHTRSQIQQTLSLSTYIIQNHTSIVQKKQVLV